MATDILKIASINLPDVYLALVDKMVVEGSYPSRSELMRKVVEDFLLREKAQTQTFETFLKAQIKPNSIINKKPIQVTFSK